MHRDFWPSLLELAQRFGETHWFSVTVGVATLALLIGLKRYAPHAPGALIALAAVGVAAFLFGLETRGVKVVGEIPSGLPSFALPGIGYKGVQGVFMDALGLVIVSFTSTMLTGRSFAARKGYSIDADQEMRAVGYANLASGLCGGFAIPGAILYRFEAPLLFFNADYFKARVLSLVDSTQPRPFICAQR